MPKRIQRKRTKGWRMPEGAVAVTRPSEFGNPYRVTVGTILTGERKGAKTYFVDRGEGDSTTRIFDDRNKAIEAAVELFRIYAMHPANSTWRDRARLALRGKSLMCFCPLNSPCHADVLLELANGPREAPNG